MNFSPYCYSFSLFNSITKSLYFNAERKQDGDLMMQPIEAIVFAGANVTFTCSHPKNVTFLWDFSSKIRSYEVVHGETFSNLTFQPVFFSRITIFTASRLMSGEVACSVDDGDSKSVGFLIVNGKLGLHSLHKSHLWDQLLFSRIFVKRVSFFNYFFLLLLVDACCPYFIF